MAQNNELAAWPLGTGADQTFKNYGGTDIAAGLAVKYDTSNVGGENASPGVVITSSDANPIGITLDVIPAGGYGRVRRAGMAKGTASATIHVGDFLKTDSAGKVLPQTAALYQVGIAGSEALSGDLVLVWVSPAKNA